MRIVFIASTHMPRFVHKNHEQTQNVGQRMNPVACKRQDSHVTKTDLWQPNNWGKNCLATITVVLNATCLFISLFMFHLTRLSDHTNNLI
jgi:hypothetical protein